MTPGHPTIASLLPHAAPMIFLDELLDWGDDCAVCTATIRSTTPFVEGDRLATVVAMEHMAQCVAVWSRLVDEEPGMKPKVGFLIACRELDLLVDWLSVGDRLRVESRRVWGDADLGQFACTVHRGETLVAKARMSAYRGPLDPSQGPPQS